MFTGIVEGLGKIQKMSGDSKGMGFWIEFGRLTRGLRRGDSISINGVCLTVCDLKKTTAKFEAIPETLKLTNLGELKTGSFVNVERSMPADGRFGGHFVQGHVDCRGSLETIKKEGDNSRILKILLPKGKAKHLLPKGSVCLDGISLTIIDSGKCKQGSYFTVGIIPHTWKMTNLQHRKPGDALNIEFDVYGKWVEHLLKEGKTKIPEQAL